MCMHGSHQNHFIKLNAESHTAKIVLNNATICEHQYSSEVALTSINIELNWFQCKQILHLFLDTVFRYSSFEITTKTML